MRSSFLGNAWASGQSRPVVSGAFLAGNCPNAPPQERPLAAAVPTRLPLIESEGIRGLPTSTVFGF